MILIISCVLVYLCLGSQYLKKVAEQKSANTSCCKYIQHMTAAFIFSAGCKSTSEAFNLIVN